MTTLSQEIQAHLETYGSCPDGLIYAKWVPQARHLEARAADLSEKVSKLEEEFRAMRHVATQCADERDALRRQLAALQAAKQ